MRMKQREILNHIELDFARDNQPQEAYVQTKIAEIKAATREYLKLSGMKGFILGLSGGIDSFVVASLAADAIKETGGIVYLLLMPNGVQKDIADAEECRDVLLRRFDNVETDVVSIEHAYQGVVQDISASSVFDPENKYALGNIQARLRMVEQYALNRGLLVLGTDHATENVVGYFTKYGDGGSDFNPIDGLLKPDIYEIAALYGAPECVMNKKPAAGLGISNSDEEELGLSYDELATYLKGNLLEKEKMQRVVSLYEASMHKRHLPASPKNDWWRTKEEDVTHVIVDMIHDFVDGSMACQNAVTAVEAAVAYCNAHPEMRVLYVRDVHPEDHCSFENNGGDWPAHAVEHTEGMELMEQFYDIKKTVNTPIARYNVFKKGTDATREEYSGFNAQNEVYGALKFNLTGKVVVSGIATEYCVKNTVMDLLKNGFQVSILQDALGFVDEEAHEIALAEMVQAGAKLL